MDGLAVEAMAFNVLPYNRSLLSSKKNAEINFYQ